MPDTTPVVHRDLQGLAREPSNVHSGSKGADAYLKAFDDAKSGVSKQSTRNGGVVHTQVVISFSDKMRFATLSSMPLGHWVIEHSGHRMGKTTVLRLPLPSPSGSILL